MLGVQLEKNLASTKPNDKSQTTLPTKKFKRSEKIFRMFPYSND